MSRKKCPRWSRKEIKLLKTLFPSHTISELSSILGRTHTSTRTKASELGLKKSAEFLSRTQKKTWKNPGVRKARTEGTSKSWTPDRRKIASEKLKVVFSSPEVKLRRSIARKRLFKKRPELRRVISLSSKKSWRNRAYRSKVTTAIRKGMAKPESVKLRSRLMSKRWRKPEFRRRVSEALSMQGCREESGLEKRFRDAFDRPHHDIPKFGWKWDMAFPKYKTFVEIQGCHVHRCPHCKRPGTTVGTFPRKRQAAYRNGWRVVQVRSCKARRVLANPRKWFEEKIAK